MQIALFALVWLAAAGINWQQTNPNPTASNLQAIGGSDGHYVICGWEFMTNTSSNIVTTLNGFSSFEPAYNDEGPAASGLNCGVAASPNGYVVIYEGTPAEFHTTLYTSPDGISWTKKELAWGMQGTFVYGNGVYVSPEMWMAPPRAVMNFYVSADGVNWDQHPSPVPPGTEVLMTFAMGHFMAWSFYGDTVFESVDGISWKTAFNLSASLGTPVYQLGSVSMSSPENDSGATQFVAAGQLQSGDMVIVHIVKTCTSISSCTWGRPKITYRNSNVNDPFPVAACVSGISACVCTYMNAPPYQEVTTYVIISSNGGASWTAQNPSQAFGGFTNVFPLEVDNYVIGLGEFGLILFSADAENWSQHDEGVVGDLTAPYVWEKQLFVVGSDWGGIYSSPDGINWSLNFSTSVNAVQIIPAAVTGKKQWIAAAEFQEGGGQNGGGAGSMNVSIVDPDNNFDVIATIPGPENCCDGPYSASVGAFIVYGNRVLFGANFCRQFSGCYVGGFWSTAIPMSQTTTPPVWDAATFETLSDAYLMDIAFGNGVFSAAVCVKTMYQHGLCYGFTSKDGISFTLTNPNSLNSSSAGCYIQFVGPTEAPTQDNGGLFFSNCFDGFPYAATSTDGVTWTRTSGLPAQSFAFSYLETPIGQYRYAAGSGAEFATSTFALSPDGHTWTVIDPRDVRQLDFVASMSGVALGVSTAIDAFYITTP